MNPDTSVRCDCGFDFSIASTEAIRAELAWSERAALQKATRGLIAGLAAIGYSIYSYVTASPGGKYMIYYGAAVAGFLLVGRSIDRILDLRRARRELGVPVKRT
jgi:hypothetical protein